MQGTTCYSAFIKAWGLAVEKAGWLVSGGHTRVPDNSVAQLTKTMQCSTPFNYARLKPSAKVRTVINVAEISPTSKPWWESKAQWGLLIGTLGFVLQAFGVAFDAAAATEVIWAFVQAIGLALAFYGNAKRELPLNLRQILPGLTLKSNG